MREVFRDVQTEPTLLPINENDYQRNVNTADNASRLDKDHTSYLTVTFWEVPGKWQRSTNDMKNRRINTIKE